jgi:hypothetical protein
MPILYTKSDWEARYVSCDIIAFNDKKYTFRGMMAEANGFGSDWARRLAEGGGGAGNNRDVIFVTAN